MGSVWHESYLANTSAVGTYVTETLQRGAGAGRNTLSRPWDWAAKNLSSYLVSQDTVPNISLRRQTCFDAYDANWKWRDNRRALALLFPGAATGTRRHCRKIYLHIWKQVTFHWWWREWQEWARPLLSREIWGWDIRNDEFAKQNKSETVP